MTLLVCFRRVCPIHVQFLLAISPDAVLVCPPDAVLVCPPDAVLVCPPDAVLVCPPDLFVCGFILPFGFQDVSQTMLLMNV